MSVWPDPAAGQACGCLGCHRDAVAVIEHPDHGRRTVCEEHVGEHEVVRDV